jgi:hypothetical protein
MNSLKPSCKAALTAAAFAGLLACQSAFANPVLSISASPDPALIGAPVVLDVQLGGVLDLYAYQFSLSFDPSILQATDVSSGSLLGTGGATFFSGGTIDNAAGTISLVFDTLLGPVAGVSGSGVLAQLTFNVTAAGTTALGFANTLFLDSGLDTINVQVNDGMLTAVPEMSTWLYLGLGLVGLAALRRRQQA